MLPSDSRFWQYKVYADIRGGTLERGIKRQWSCRKWQFLVLSLAISSKALEVRTANIIIWYYLVIVAFPLTP